MGATDIHPKVMGSTVTGAIATLIVTGAAYFGIEIPTEAAAGFVATVMAIAGYMTPS